MQRVLDIDLDFFVEPIAYHRTSEHERLDPAAHSVWPVERAKAFLAERCRLERPLPGFAVEHHGEQFGRWDRAIAAGVLKPPFHVTHVDAHADLGLGGRGWEYLLTVLPTLPVDDRPAASIPRLVDADYLAFAIGCRWVADVVYVKHGDCRGTDVHPYLREDFDRSSSRVRLAALTPAQLAELRAKRPPTVDYVEPSVLVDEIPWADFQADRGFDFVCLARSAPYTPPTADPLYEELRATFIEEIPLP